MCNKTIQKIIALLLLACFGLVGCWDVEEITSLAPISALGFDIGSEPDKLRVSAQISLPDVAEGGGGASASRLRVLTVEADSLVSAIALMQSRTRRRHFFAHLSYIVFGSELAQNGLGTATESVQAWPQIRGSTLTFVAETTAEATLHAHSGIGKNPGEDIADIIRNVSSVPVARRMTLNNLVTILSRPGSTSLTLPILGLKPLALSSGDETPPSGVSQTGERYMELYLAGTALFEQDRWAESLSIRETQTLAVLAGQANRGASTMTNPTNAEGVIAPQYERIRVKHLIQKLPEGEVQIGIKIKLDIRLFEIHGGYNPDEQHAQPIEEAVKADVEKRIRALLQKLQGFGLDSLNLAQRCQQRTPKLWQQIEEDWPSLYQTAQLQVEADATIRTLGIIKYFPPLGESR